MILTFSELAVEDLKRIRNFITEYHPEMAQRVARQIIGSINRLKETPQIGLWLPQFDGEIREFTFGQYVVRYAQFDESLCILRIWHGKEDRS